MPVVLLLRPHVAEGEHNCHFPALPYLLDSSSSSSTRHFHRLDEEALDAAAEAAAAGTRVRFYQPGGDVLFKGRRKGTSEKG
jgi:hypothetical protein